MRAASVILVEVRTDEGSHPLELDIANLTLKELLLIQFYADPAFGRAFRYDHEDIARARRNEAEAARDGLKAEIENPFTGKPVGLRDFLRWTLEQVRGAMGWQPRVAATLAETPAPTAEELRLIREELDPSGVYTK